MEDQLILEDPNMAPGLYIYNSFSLDRRVSSMYSMHVRAHIIHIYCALGVGGVILRRRRSTNSDRSSNVLKSLPLLEYY